MDTILMLLIFEGDVRSSAIMVLSRFSLNILAAAPKDARETENSVHRIGMAWAS